MAVDNSWAKINLFIKSKRHHFSSSANHYGSLFSQCTEPLSKYTGRAILFVLESHSALAAYRHTKPHNSQPIKMQATNTSSLSLRQMLLDFTGRGSWLVVAFLAVVVVVGWCGRTMAFVRYFFFCGGSFEHFVQLALSSVIYYLMRFLCMVYHRRWIEWPSCEYMRTRSVATIIIIIIVCSTIQCVKSLLRTTTKKHTNE